MLGIEHVVPPTAAGLSPADLIGILSILVIVFGLLLTAIGVLVLRLMTGLDSKITSVKLDAAAALVQVKQEYADDLKQVWQELGRLREQREKV